MALTIDGSTYHGFWKITQDSVGAPDNWYMIPKNELIQYSQSVNTGRFLLESDPTFSSFNSSYDDTCIDENGNALATSAAVSLYISQNR